MIERIDFWGIPETWRYFAYFVAYGVVTLCAVVMLARFYNRIRWVWKVGRPEQRWDRPLVRLWRVVEYGIAQVKVLGQTYPGLMHVAIAWGFFVLFMGTALATINGHFFTYLRGGVYLAYKLALDTFTVVALIGLGMAAYRRFVQKPARLTLTLPFAGALGLIFIIVLTGLLTESLRLAALAQDPALQPGWNTALAWWSPAGWITAQLWLVFKLTPASIVTIHLWLWMLHAGLVAAFFVVLPTSTLVHLFTTLLNVFFSKLDRPVGQLAPIAENAQKEPIYASTLRGLTWKQLLDSETCTECGRCQDACPAFAAGLPLSPKQVMVALRDALHRDGQALAGGDGKAQPPIIGEALTEAMLWSCTTCGACVRECPVLVEHVDAIVDMRRYLVNEGRMDSRLQETLANLGRYGNSFGQSERARAKWAQPVQPKIKDARKEAVDYLWFVGDYASYNASLTDLTRKTAEVFRRAGLDFGLLYEGERNAGNDVRRVGEEGLFEMLVEKNKAAFGKATFKTIITTDPHSYNALKLEYPANGSGPHPVVHYAELLDQRIASGQLKLSKKLGYKVTYHDPCYLGRYNGIYDAPRRVIEATGCELVEMPRHGDRALCCGAGGGRIWMDETGIKERPSEARIREAVALAGVSVFVAACPKDITMYRDAVKTTGQENRLVVKDLAELVFEAL